MLRGVHHRGAGSYKRGGWDRDDRTESSGAVECAGSARTRCAEGSAGACRAARRSGGGAARRWTCVLGRTGRCRTAAGLRAGRTGSRRPDRERLAAARAGDARSAQTRHRGRARAGRWRGAHACAGSGRAPLQRERILQRSLHPGRAGARQRCVISAWATGWRGEGVGARLARHAARRQGGCGVRDGLRDLPGRAGPLCGGTGAGGGVRGGPIRCVRSGEGAVPRRCSGRSKLQSRRKRLYRHPLGALQITARRSTRSLPAVHRSSAAPERREKKACLRKEP